MAGTSQSSDASSAQPIDVDRHGEVLLQDPLLNKGTAFSEEERDIFDVRGLLPPEVESLDEQAERAYRAYKLKDVDLERHIYLRALQDTNETLFYRLVLDHITEMMPMIYTPVVGEACQKFSEIYRRPRGLFISYPDRDRIDDILEHAPEPHVEVIVVTDGERILGLGDQGTGGMGIPIGKLSLYTGCGGIDPGSTLPIVLDVGTNNQERLDDPFYIGWRHERVTGQDYYDFVDQFVQAVKRKLPNVLLQFEDFAVQHAHPLLSTYRDQLCTFNDDIQGTAAVTVGTLLAATKVAGKPLKDHNVVMFGAGSAGCGIAEQMVSAMVKDGLSDAEARERFFMIDRPGLLHDGMSDLRDFQKVLAQPQATVAGWASGGDGTISLADTVTNAKAGILIGVSGQPNQFDEALVRQMAQNVERPIIVPLSNPTSRIEAQPADLIAWTEGRALIATGSPFDPIDYKGKSFEIAQCNNSYIFPGMGLGILGIGARRVSDAMFMAASEALSSCAPAVQGSGTRLLPTLDQVREVGKVIAKAVATQAVAEGLADAASEAEIDAKIAAKFWTPRYRTYRDSVGR
ncbi:MAG: NAD-dependent malic enzyme [Pseudomonadota bacterium]